MLSEKALMMFDGKLTIRNKNRIQDAVAQLGSVAILPARDGNVFTMNTSNRDWYIPNTT